MTPPLYEVSFNLEVKPANAKSKLMILEGCLIKPAQLRISRYSPLSILFSRCSDKSYLPAGVEGRQAGGGGDGDPSRQARRRQRHHRPLPPDQPLGGRWAGNGECFSPEFSLFP